MTPRVERFAPLTWDGTLCLQTLRNLSTFSTTTALLCKQDFSDSASECRGCRCCGLCIVQPTGRKEPAAAGSASWNQFSTGGTSLDFRQMFLLPNGACASGTPALGKETSFSWMLPGSLEVAWEDAGVTQPLAAGGMSSPGTVNHVCCGQRRSFIPPLCGEHHKPLCFQDAAVPRGPQAHNEEGQGGECSLFMLQWKAGMTRWKSCKIRRWFYCSTSFCDILTVAIFPLENTVTVQISLWCHCHPPREGLLPKLKMQQMRWLVLLLPSPVSPVQPVHRLQTQKWPVSVRTSFLCPSEGCFKAGSQALPHLKSATNFKELDVTKLLIHVTEGQKGNCHYICIYAYILMKKLTFCRYSPPHTHTQKKENKYLKISFLYIFYQKLCLFWLRCWGRGADGKASVIH